MTTKPPQSMKESQQIKKDFFVKFGNTNELEQEHIDYFLAIIEQERKEMVEKIKGLKHETKSASGNPLTYSVTYNMAINDVLSLLTGDKE